MNTPIDERRVDLRYLHRLIQQAWLDLQRARRDRDTERGQRAERRMNALLDRL